MAALIGRKLGMTQVFADDGRVERVTVVEAGPCPVTAIRTADRDGYEAVQLAFGDVRADRLSKPLRGHFEAHGRARGRYLVELRTDDASSYTPGQEITVDAFRPGERADVVGVSKGKGFAGTMKRHGFGGLPASHGTERKHRSPGAIGAAATPSRVFKGTRMAGQLGNERVTVLNLQVVHIDPERHLMLLKGAVPGPRGGLVMVRSSVRDQTGRGA